MQAWQDILATAVVGTERQQLSIAPSSDELGSLLTQIETTDRESLLLNSAALIALYRRAGQSPEADSQPPVELCPPEELVRISPAVGQYLLIMLDGEFKDVLPELLTTIKASGARIPEEFLPALLDKGRAEQSLRELIVAVTGQRGKWLAARNPEWHYATRPSDKDVWETGSHDERLALLDTLRLRDPATARELIAGTWQQESAKARAAFLATLLVNISSDDEPFLTEALRDRNGDVRRVARRLLTRLPNSEFSRRVRKLMAEVVTIKKPLLGRARIEVSIPDDPAGWLQQQDIEIDTMPKHLTQSVGPKAWTLKELVALTPVVHWTELWQKSPAEIVSAAYESEWEAALSEGLVLALNRDNDPVWIEALIGYLHNAKPMLIYPTVVKLTSQLPPARFEIFLMTLLKAISKGLNDTYPALQYLLVYQKPWSDQLSRTVINSIKQRIPRIKKDETIDWQTRAALTQFAYYISPYLYDELAGDWPMDSENWPSWSKAVDRFNSLLAFRRDLHLAISKKEQNT